MVDNKTFMNLKKLCKKPGAYFHFYQSDFVINTPVINAQPYEGNEFTLEIHFEGGHVQVWKDESTVKECIRPDNLIVDCEQCFRLINSDGVNIGYIYKEQK